MRGQAQAVRVLDEAAIDYLIMTIVAVIMTIESIRVVLEGVC